VLVFKTPFSARLLLTLLLGSTVCAELMFLLSLAFKRTERFMLAGGIVMLAALFAGGVIYPLNLMPEAVQKLSILSVARHMFAGIVPEAAGGGSGLGPLAAAAGILALLCGAAAAALGGSAARRHGSAKGGA
jgi:ABC-type multidrug transport system permease subunit